MSLTRREVLGVLIVSGGLLDRVGVALANDEDAEDYLSEQYKQRREEERDPHQRFQADVEKLLPGLCQQWLVPPNLLLSPTQRASWDYIHASEFRFRRAFYSHRLTKAQAWAIAHQFPDAICDPDAELHAYRTPRAVQDRLNVFALPVRPADARVGMHRGSVPVSVRERDFGFGNDSLQLRSVDLLAADKRHRIGLYAGYERSNGEIRRMSTVLYTGDWRLIARRDLEFNAGGTWCDGCATPCRVSRHRLRISRFQSAATPTASVSDDSLGPKLD